MSRPAGGQEPIVRVGPRRSAGQPRSRLREFFTRWWLVGVLIGTFFIGLGIGNLLVLTSRPLSLLVIAITIAAALAPLVNWLQRRLPRWLAVILVYLALLIVVAAIFWFVIPALTDQAQQVINAVPGIVKQVQDFLGSIQGLGQINLSNALPSQLSNLGSTILSLPVLIFSSLFDVAVIVFLSIYWLLAVPSMARANLALFPAKNRPEVERLFADIGQAMGGYVRASAINGAIIGVLSYVAYMLIGVHYPVVLGLLAGVLELVPTIGPIIAGAVAVLVALLQSPVMALIVVGAALAIHQFENHILVPNIMRSQTQLSPPLVIAALIIGDRLGGLLGILVSVPLASALRVLVDYYMAPAVRRWTGAPPPSPPTKEQEKEREE